MKKDQPARPKQTAKKTNKPSFSWVWVYVAVLLYVMLSPLISGNSIKEITWQQFSKNILNRRAVEKLEVVNREHVNVYIKSSLAGDTAFKEVFKPAFGNGKNYGPHYTFTIGSVESFERHLDEAEQNFGQRAPALQKPFSEATGELIDQEIRKLVAQAYLNAKTILAENKPLLEKVAALLLEQEVIEKEDLENILGKRDPGLTLINTDKNGTLNTIT